MRPGLYENLDAIEYHNDPCEVPALNYSTAKPLLTKSPWHARKQHPRLGGERWTPSKKMDEGSIVHALLLEQPLDGLIEVIDADSFRTNAAKAARDAAQLAGKLVILADRFNELKAGVPLIRDNLHKANVDLDGIREASILWETDECQCRTRIDLLSRNHCKVTDLKCTTDPDPHFLERQVIDMCYDVQAAAEIEAVESVFSEAVGRVEFEDVFIWTAEPWFVIAVEHRESLLEHGRSRWKRAKELWAKCLREDNWPGPRNRIGAFAPAWAMRKEFGEEYDANV